MLNFVLFFIAVILAVVLGMKTKVNMGVWAYMFAFILGLFFCNMSVSQVIAKFPTSNFYMFVIAAMFYAFGQLNGTISLMAKKLVYKFRNQTWMGPFVLFVIASVISLSGAGGTTGLIITGMIYPFAAAMNINLLPCLVAVHAAAGGWGFVPWTAAGANNVSIFSQYSDPDMALNSSFVAVVIATIVYIIALVVVSAKHGVFKKRELQAGVVEVEKPEDFSPEQRKTFWIIIAAIILIVIPIFLKTVIPTAFTKRLAAIFCIQTVWTLGVIVLALLNLGDLKEIIAKKVPWNTIILVTGMCTMFGLAQALGVVDVLGNIVAGVPKILVLPCLALVNAILSFFVSGVVLAPFFAPLIPTFAAATGISPLLLMAAVCAGGGATSISPVSAGGAYVLSGVPDGPEKEKATGGLAKVAIFNLPVEFIIWLVISILFVK